MGPIDDRRGAVRAAVGSTLATLPATVDVQVLDINVEGVLLRAGQSFDVGTQAHLRLNLSNAVFDADVEVRRVSPATNDGTTQWYDVGATFQALSREHRQLIERFASQ